MSARLATCASCGKAVRHVSRGLCGRCSYIARGGVVGRRPIQASPSGGGLNPVGLGKPVASATVRLAADSSRLRLGLRDAERDVTRSGDRSHAATSTAPWQDRQISRAGGVVCPGIRTSVRAAP